MEFGNSLESLIQRWMDRSVDAAPLALRVPLADFLDEAVELAALVDQVAEPLEGEGGRPGLSQVFIDDGLPNWETAGEMRELALVIGEVVARQASNESSVSATSLVREARLLRSEWFRIMGYLFERNQDEHGLSVLSEHRQLAQRQDFDGVRISLGQLTEFLESQSELLPEVGVASEEVGVVRRMWERLNAHHDEKRNTTRRRREQRVTRDRLLRLLDDRVVATRRAMRFVFRHHPSIIDKSQSDYARTKRRKLSARRRRD